MKPVMPLAKVPGGRVCLAPKRQMFGTRLTVCLSAGFNPPILNCFFDGPAFDRAATAVEALDAVRFLALAADIKAPAVTPRGTARD